MKLRNSGLTAKQLFPELVADLPFNPTLDKSKADESNSRPRIWRSGSSYGWKRCRRRSPGRVRCLCECTPIGVNPVETYIRAGTYARLPELPYTPGNDGAGVVEQVGSDVSEFKAGDRVYTAGSISRRRMRSSRCAKRSKCIRCRQMFRSRKARPWGRRTRRRIAGCCSAPMRSQVKRCWCTARAAVSGRRRCNWRALAVCACSARRAAMKESSSRVEQGAHEVFDHRAPDHFEQIMKATGGHGVDVIVELLANVNLGKDLTILAKGGRVVIIGSRGRVEIDPRDTMQRDADVRGMILPNTPPAELASIHAALVAGLENGTLRPVIGKEFPLAEAAQAHRAVMESGALGKIVLVPGK